MLALQRQDLAVMPSFALSGARLLRPPGELPPLAAGEAVCPLMPSRKAATIEYEPAISQDSVGEPPAGHHGPHATPRRGGRRAAPTPSASSTGRSWRRSWQPP